MSDLFKGLDHCIDDQSTELYCNPHAMTSSSNFMENTIAEFHHQIAGHTKEKVKRYGPDRIIKPLDKPDLFRREVYFYEQMFLKENDDNYMTRFIPRYFGVVEVKSENNNLKRNREADSIHASRGDTTPAIILQDLTLSYEQPCLMDVKIGRQTYEPTAGIEKQQRELRKYPYQYEIGFRITGLKVWDTVKRCYHTFAKPFGRSLAPEQVLLGLAVFFFDGTRLRFDVLNSVVTRLQGMLAWMRTQSKCKFFCSSILIVYDGFHVEETEQAIKSSDSSGAMDSTAADSTLDSSHSPKKPICRASMIDFAHVIWNDAGAEEVDEGYVYGLSNLIKNLQLLCEPSRLTDTAFLESIKELISKHRIC